MQRQVWQMYTLQTGPCDGATGNTGDSRVLSWGMEMQVWQQVLHAMINEYLIFSMFDIFDHFILVNYMKTLILLRWVI